MLCGDHKQLGPVVRSGFCREQVHTARCTHTNPPISSLASKASVHSDCRAWAYRCSSVFRSYQCTRKPKVVASPIWCIRIHAPHPLWIRTLGTRLSSQLCQCSSTFTFRGVSLHFMLLAHASASQLIAHPLSLTGAQLSISRVSACTPLSSLLQQHVDTFC